MLLLSTRYSSPPLTRADGIRDQPVDQVISPINNVQSMRQRKIHRKTHCSMPVRLRCNDTMSAVVSSVSASTAVPTPAQFNH